MLQDISISFITHHLTTHMKKITVMALAAFAASIMASCCCQDQGAPPLTPLPKFNDLNQPAVDVAKGLPPHPALAHSIYLISHSRV